ncbi:MAG: hypothetical protein AB9866_14845 [Syntrophobacteraceae bacterium]
MLNRTNLILLICVLNLASACVCCAEPFGHKGGPDIENIGEVNGLLRQHPYDLELLLSFGTSKGGSAGHLALAVRDQATEDDLVYSANFYADLDPKHEKGYYKKNLITMVPKTEYLFKTTSSLGPDASFGLDMGEIYKRSVIGIRIRGVQPKTKDGLKVFFERLNSDFHARKQNTDYHHSPIVYGYMNLNCAKTVGLAFKYGAGFDDLPVKGTSFLSRLNPISATKANLPTEMAMDLIKILAKRNCTFDVVLYKKWVGSTYVDPLEESGMMYRDLPNRFPSVLSLDYRENQGSYEDYHNLFAMYLLYNLGRYSIVLNGETRRLEIEHKKEPDSYATALLKADESATKDKKHFLRRLVFRAWGIKLDSGVDNTHLYGGELPE